MIECRAEHLSLIREILQRHVPGQRVLAFGSRVRGGARAYSDLDLAVIGDRRLPFERIALLKEAFETSTLPFRVDVVDWHRLSEGFREAIIHDAVAIQPRAEPARGAPSP